MGVKASRARVTAWLVCAMVVTVSGIAQAAAAPVSAGPKPAVAALEDPFNARISVAVAADGRFSAGAFPNPLTGGPTAFSYPILFGWPTTSTSFTTVMVDGVADVYGSSGTQVQAPTEAGATNTSAWSNGDVTTRQTLSVDTNPLTGLADAARIAYTVTNGGAVSRSVGVRTLLDTDVDNNDGSPFLIPGLGPVTTEQDFSGAAVPDHFQILPALGAGTRLAGAALRGADATPPDRLVIADWPRIGATAWDYAVTPGRSITTDSAYAAYWNPRDLGPGASVTFVTYYAAITPPEVTGLNPPSGAAGGGTAVTVTGTELSGATAVAFGSVPAAGFRVDGPTQITATAPPGTGTVAVRVTTPEGTSAPSDADLFTYGAPPPAPTQPTSQTQPAEGVTSDSAELVAAINPRGLATTMHFEYGVDPAGAAAAALSYSSRTPDQPVAGDFADHSLTAVVASLQPNSTYHVRAVAANALGVTAGTDVTFRTASDAPPPPPILGKAFNAQPVSGRVLVLLPASARSGQARASAVKGVGYIPLTEARQLPVGTIFNAASGSVRLTTATATRGRVQAGTFGGGVFKLLQSRRARGLSELSLQSGAGAAKKCAATAGKAQTAAKRALPKTVLNLLRAKGTGHFQSHGRFSSATVRGTTWTTTDRCDGTLTSVQRGVVVVTDLRRKRQVVVRAGRAYLARAP